MNGSDEKSGIGGWWPPFIMDTRHYDFGLSEKATNDLNKMLYKARLQYLEDIANAEKKFVDTVQGYLKEIRF